jgi:hypothetical protein
MTQTEVLKMVLKKLEHLWDIGIDAEYKVELLPEIHAIKNVLNEETQPHWVGLTDEEIEMVYAITVKTHRKAQMPSTQLFFAKTIQEYLKEKNT